MIRAGSRSFDLASRLMPCEAREAASAIYAFCRMADDEIDISGGAQPAIARLHEGLDRIYRGAPGFDPIERALADAVHGFSLPRAALEALLEGLEWDAAGRRYDTLSQVRAYSARVAGSVGALMAALMGSRAPAMVARACDLGVAMQLTNIARDVGEDARAGRLYLPRDWLREHGLDPDAWLADPRPHPAIAAATRRLLDEADRLYVRADCAIARLPRAFRPGIRAARLLYAEIGRELLRRGGDSVSGRTIVPLWRKLGLLLRAALWPYGGRRGLAAPPLPETRFLVRAVRPLARARPAAPWWRLGAHLDWTIALFGRLEARARAPNG